MTKLSPIILCWQYSQLQKGRRKMVMQFFVEAFRLNRRRGKRHCLLRASHRPADRIFRRCATSKATLLGFP